MVLKTTLVHSFRGTVPSVFMSCCAVCERCLLELCAETHQVTKLNGCDGLVETKGSFRGQLVGCLWLNLNNEWLLCLDAHCLARWQPYSHFIGNPDPFPEYSPVGVHWWAALPLSHECWQMEDIIYLQEYSVVTSMALNRLLCVLLNDS